MSQDFCFKPSTKFSETNSIFKLCQINSLIFLSSSVIIAIKQHFGKPIDCIYEGIVEQQKTFVDTFCWQAHFPIAPQVTPISYPFAAVNKDLQVYSSSIYFKKQAAYNQWLSLILLFQAVIAFIPTWLWRLWRDKRLYETISNIKEPNKQPSRRKLLIMNLANDICTDTIQRRYARPFFLSEIFNIVSIVVNVLIINFFFQHRFIMFGIYEIGGSTEEEEGFIPELFPVFAKCTVQIGVTGSGNRKEEATCMVSFNSLCKTLFILLWIWLLFLSLASIIGVTYRLLMMLSRRTRRNLLMEILDLSFEEKLNKICENLGFYSWFTLYRISKNVDPLTFQDIISSLIAHLDSLSLYKTRSSCKERTRRRDSIPTTTVNIIPHQEQPSKPTSKLTSKLSTIV